MVAVYSATVVSLMAAEVAAVVKAVHAEVGQQVRTGDLLLELD